MSTSSLSYKDIKRSWHLLDAKGKVLGRLATQAATLLAGKSKINYVPYLDGGDNVVVINAALVTVTGSKTTDKKYYRHSGYPGGMRVETFTDLQKRQPETILTHAIKGMLPKTKLGKVMIKKLHVFAGKEHPFDKQIQGDKDAK